MAIIRQQIGKHVYNSRGTVGSASRLYNEDPRPAERMISERVDSLQLMIEGTDKSSAWVAVTKRT
jgi:hypothetical protein